MSLHSTGQTNTVFNPSDTVGKNLTARRLVINYYSPADANAIQRLSELVGASLNFYIDDYVEINNQGKIKIKKSKKEMLRDMNDIVRSAVKYFSYKEIENFKGFSKNVESKLDEIQKLNFDQSPYASQAKSEAEKKRLTYYYVQKELNDLKLLANIEVGNFSNDNLLMWTGSEETVMTDAERDSLLKWMQYDPNTPLGMRTSTYSDATQNILNTGDQSSLSVLPAQNNGDINERILALLETNNARLEAMQGQIDQLRTDQLTLLEAKQNERNQELQAQIDDLRGMVIDLVKYNNSSATASNGGSVILPRPTPGAVSNVPKSINLYFARAEVALNTNATLSLNEVVDIMARNPQLKLIITGYADKTGNPQVNLALSQRRAKTVKEFLIKSGLEENRFITRYLGDSNSDQENQNDRKVVLEFIGNN